MKSTFLTLSLLALAGAAQAATVTGWVATNGDTGFSGGSAATNSPITTDADADTIVGSFTSTTLALGETLLVTGQFNVANAGTTLAGGQLRIGAFESTSGLPATGVGSGYIGAWANDPNGKSFTTTTGTATNPFSGANNHATLDNGTGPVLASNTTYDFALSLTRLAGNDLTVALDLNGGAFFSDSADLNTFGGSGSYTFDSVGFLLGGSLNSTSATFTDIEANVVPEPSSAALLGLGGLALLLRRRK